MKSTNWKLKHCTSWIKYGHMYTRHNQKVAKLQQSKGTKVQTAMLLKLFICRRAYLRRWRVWQVIHGMNSISRMDTLAVLSDLLWRPWPCLRRAISTLASSFKTLLRFSFEYWFHWSRLLPRKKWWCKKILQNSLIALLTCVRIRNRTISNRMQLCFYWASANTLMVWKLSLLTFALIFLRKQFKSQTRRANNTSRKLSRSFNCSSKVNRR